MGGGAGHGLNSKTMTTTRTLHADSADNARPHVTTFGPRLCLQTGCGGSDSCCRRLMKKQVALHQTACQRRRPYRLLTCLPPNKLC